MPYCTAVEPQVIWLTILHNQIRAFVLTTIKLMFRKILNYSAVLWSSQKSNITEVPGSFSDYIYVIQDESGEKVHALRDDII